MIDKIIHINGHDIGLKRVQCVSPVSPAGTYRITLVSGWELPIDDAVYPREAFVRRWREFCMGASADLLSFSQSDGAIARKWIEQNPQAAINIAMNAQLMKSPPPNTPLRGFND